MGCNHRRRNRHHYWRHVRTAVNHDRRSIKVESCIWRINIRKDQKDQNHTDREPKHQKSRPADSPTTHVADSNARCLICQGFGS